MHHLSLVLHVSAQMSFHSWYSTHVALIKQISKYTSKWIYLIHHPSRNMGIYWVIQLTTPNHTSFLETFENDCRLMQLPVAGARAWSFMRISDRFDQNLTGTRQGLKTKSLILYDKFTLPDLTHMRWDFYGLWECGIHRRLVVQSWSHICKYELGPLKV